MEWLQQLLQKNISQKKQKKRLQTKWYHFLPIGLQSSPSTDAFTRNYTTSTLCPKLVHAMQKSKKKQDNTNRTPRACILRSAKVWSWKLFNTILFFFPTSYSTIHVRNGKNQTPECLSYHQTLPFYYNQPWTDETTLKCQKKKEEEDKKQEKSNLLRPGDKRRARSGRSGTEQTDPAYPTTPARGPNNEPPPTPRGGLAKTAAALTQKRHYEAAVEGGRRGGWQIRYLGRRPSPEIGTEEEEEVAGEDDRRRGYVSALFGERGITYGRPPPVFLPFGSPAVRSVYIGIILKD